MKNAAYLLISCLISTLAYAGPGQKGEQKAQYLSFNQIRDACLDPAKYHNQVAPTNIRIACRDVQAKWVPDADGALTMDTKRQVMISVISDKYSSAQEQGSVPCSSHVAACPRFREVLETLETVRAVTCEELVAFTGTAVEFCASATNNLRALNPQALQVQETGRVVDLCDGYAGPQRQKDQKPRER